MLELKHSLDARGHALLEMPTGTGKTVTLLSLITSYQLAHPEVGKLVYCTRTVPEMEKVLEELQNLVRFRSDLGVKAPILGLGLSSRKNLCIHTGVVEEGSRESVDAKCRRLTASWVRERAEEDAQVDLCSFYEDYRNEGAEALLPPGVYTLEDMKRFGREKGWCPYFLARHMLSYANVIVYNYQYMLDPKVSTLVSRELERECVVVFDEAHNIDNVCIEALSVNLRQQTLDNATRGITRLRNKVSPNIVALPSPPLPSPPLPTAPQHPSIHPSEKAPSLFPISSNPPTLHTPSLLSSLLSLALWHSSERACTPLPPFL